MHKITLFREFSGERYFMLIGIYPKQSALVLLLIVSAAVLVFLTVLLILIVLLVLLIAVVLIAVSV